jgi:hypothetical protein
MNGFFSRFLARRKQAADAGTAPEYRCPFPNCGAPFEPKPNAPDACDYHRKFIMDVAFTMRHLQIRQNPPPAAKPNIVVPRGPLPGPGPAKGG